MHSALWLALPQSLLLLLVAPLSGVPVRFLPQLPLLHIGMGGAAAAVCVDLGRVARVCPLGEVARRATRRAVLRFTGSASFRERATELGGYDVDGIGEVRLIN